MKQNIGGEVCTECTVRKLNVCVSSGSVSNEWKIGCIIPLYKGKGDPFSDGTKYLDILVEILGICIFQRIPNLYLVSVTKYNYM